MFPLMNAYKFEINTTPGTAPGTLSLLAAGIMNVEQGNNEELDQTKYLDGGGYGETDVTGAQLVLTFSGHRKYGDAAQDFIFEKLLVLGNGRRTNFVITEPNGDKIEGDCTIANITPPSGDAGTKGEMSFEIHFNGLPELTAAGA